MKLITDMTPTPENQEIIYNALDCMQTMGLRERFDTILPEWCHSTYEYSEKLIGPMLCMMKRGILVDQAAQAEVVAELKDRTSGLLTSLNYLTTQLFDTNINPASGDQLKMLFYSWLGIPEVIRSKKGESKVTTDAAALESIVKNYPRGAAFANILLKLADYTKQLEFFSKPLRNGRFSGSYNISGTENFRLSSSEHPLRFGGNMQNIADHARRTFIADPGYTMFQADQQGAEARYVAYDSGDPNYINAVESGDAHTMVASMVYGFPPERELADRKFYHDKSYRDLAKRGSHGSNYYGQPFTLAQQMKCETEIAEQFQAKYFKAFPGISDWHRHIQRKLTTQGYLINALGFRRTFWGRPWDDTTLREAIAFGPQSTIGILTNCALHRIWDTYESSGDVQILANGHDAVIGQIRTEKLSTLVPALLDLMHMPFYLTDIHNIRRLCNIPWEFSIGQNWGKRNKDNPEGMHEWKP